MRDRTLAPMTRLARAAAAAFALAGVVFLTVFVRTYGVATDPRPDARALGASFETPSWALTAALVTLPLLALAGSLVLTPRRRRDR